MRCLVEAPGLIHDRYNCRITLEEEEEAEWVGFLLNYSNVQQLPDEDSEQEDDNRESHQAMINRPIDIEKDDTDYEPMEIDQDTNDKLQQEMHDFGNGDLDPKIWSGLPDTVMEKVLMCLPLHTLFKFSCVCRKWQGYLSEMSFRREYSVNNLQRQYYILMVDHRGNHNYNNNTETLAESSSVLGSNNGIKNTVFSRECLIYRKGMNRWLSLYRHSCSSCTEPYDVVAAAEGLICVKDRATGVLSVHNLMTNTWRRLPPLIKPGGRGSIPDVAAGGAGAGAPAVGSTRWAFEVGMWMHPNNIDYKIMVWTDGPAPFTQLFSSATNQWLLSKNSGDAVDIRGDPLSKCGVVSGISFYMLVINEYLSVFAYNIVEDRWSELRAPMPEHILYSYLIDAGSNYSGDGRCRCNLMMVAAIGEDFPMQGICVWKLSDDERSWIQILRMPDSLYLKLTRGFRAFDAFKCAGKDNLLCFLVDGRPRALMYDFSSGIWWWSPNISFRGQYQVISTHLRLDTQP